MQSAWDRVEDTDVERECSGLIRLPLPPPEESDDGIDLEAPTLQRVEPVLASASMSAQLAPMVGPQLVSARAQLLLALLAATAVVLAVALAVG